MELDVGQIIVAAVLLVIAGAFVTWLVHMGFEYESGVDETMVPTALLMSAFAAFVAALVYATYPGRDWPLWLFFTGFALFVTGAVGFSIFMDVPLRRRVKA